MATTYTQPNYTTQSGSNYKANIDNGMAVLAEIGQDFAPHQAATANLTVLIDAGRIIKADGTLVSQAQQTATFVAPAANPRIDRIVIDMITGAYSIIAGTEAASPTAPAITAGKLPCAQVSLTVGQTQITNANITDERTGFARLVGGAKATKTAGQSLADATYTPLTWDSEAYDTASIHDNVTNNSRLTVPTGVTRIRIRANIGFSSGTAGVRSVSLYKNGGTQIQVNVVNVVASYNMWVPLVSDLLTVTGGDYFTIEALQSNGGALSILNTLTWFEMEIVG